MYQGWAIALFGKKQIALFLLKRAKKRAKERKSDLGIHYIMASPDNFATVPLTLTHAAPKQIIFHAAAIHFLVLRVKTE